MKTDPIKYDVFISCKSEDYPEAIAIHKYLVEQGLRVFLADVELRKKGRDVYGEIIDSALESADHMIVFTSKAAYVNSTYVKSEWRTFVEEKRSGRKKGNIVTILKGVQVADLPIALRSVQYFLYKDYESVIDYLPVLSKQKSTSTPTLTSTPKKPYPNYLWPLALMPLVLIGLWLGLRNPLEPEVLSGKGREGVYQVGDYYDDGTKQGVVFEVSDGGQHGKIVSMRQSDQILMWSTARAYDQMTATDATDSREGWLNQQTIIEKHAISCYPAFAWCADQGEGWYLPAIEELKSILLDSHVFVMVNQGLLSHGGVALNKFGYWSSTEGSAISAWGIGGYKDDSIANGFSKRGSFYVRAVSVF